jgi:predicted DNA-binding ribbon-helix-helix protein
MDQIIQAPVVRKRSVTIAGHRTSVSLEEPFWDALKDLARLNGKSVNDLVTEIDTGRSGNLSSAIRIHVLDTYRGMAPFNISG